MDLSQYLQWYGCFVALTFSVQGVTKIDLRTPQQLHRLVQPSDTFLSSLLCGWLPFPCQGAGHARRHLSSTGSRDESQAYLCRTISVPVSCSEITRRGKVPSLCVGEPRREPGHRQQLITSLEREQGMPEVAQDEDAMLEACCQSTLLPGGDTPAVQICYSVQSGATFVSLGLKADSIHSDKVCNYLCGTRVHASQPNTIEHAA